MKETEYTVGITTKGGFLDALIITLPEDEELTDEIIEEQFDLYKNDEAGELLKDDELDSWDIVREDVYMGNERVETHIY